MAFSESLKFGNSTLKMLESQERLALKNGNGAKEQDKPLVDIIAESPPTLKRNVTILSKTRTRLMEPSDNESYRNRTQHRCWRRSKSDSKIPTKLDPPVKMTSSNYSEFFRSNISFSINEEKNENMPTEKNNEISMVDVSQIEAIPKPPTLLTEEEEISYDSILDAPIFSEDVQQLSESVSVEKLDSETTSKKIESKVEMHLLDESSFICPAMLDSNAAAYQKEELQQSRRMIALMPNTLNRTFNKSYTKETLKNISTVKNCTNKSFLSEFKPNKENFETLRSISAWHLPHSVVQEYERKGVVNMFDWQIECLSNPKVLFEHCNLVYSAPTSAGKTLVSEMLLLKTVLERGKKVLFILPFISVVREKMFYLQDLLTTAGYRVEGFFGGYTPPGGFSSIHVALCTIEKANSIVNKLLEQGKLEEIGTIVVDEVHLISDPSRGYILELLLAKVLYISRKYALQIQVVTMSATLANVELLKRWLDAELYITDFRPVALKEMIKVGNKIYDTQMQLLRNVTDKIPNEETPFPALQNDSDHVAQLCLETLLEGCSVVVFCPSKDWCETLATQLASAIHAVGKGGGCWGERLRTQLNPEAIEDVKKQLRDIPTGLDTVLEKTISYGCAYHHAGLTTEERDIVEASFKSGALKIIVATSTLSSGVNLPARRVLIRTPLFGGKQMNSLTYKQMIGRAGRTGKDTLGESILICTESNARIGQDLITTELKPISSCLEMENSTHLKRALLEVISSGVVSTKQDINSFVNCTLLSVEKQQFDTTEECEDLNEGSVSVSVNDDKYITSALDFLLEYEFVRMQLDEEVREEKFMATQLGLACLASSMPPTDGLILFSELQKSRRCFVLESELHAVYLVTPYSVCYQLQNLDWLLFLDLWEKLSPAMRKVGEIVGVKESFVVRAMRGQTKLDYKLLQIHKRFYTALALLELVNETPINVVATKYKCTRGLLQSLQQMSSTFAGIVTAFCNSLQWFTLALIVSQFKERLYFGIHRDLIDLMRLPDLSHKRARALYDADITCLTDLASAEVLTVEKVLYNLLSFDSEKQHENENAYEAEKRKTERNFFITGRSGLTVAEAAKLLVQEARRFVQYELGVDNIKWTQEENRAGDIQEELHMSCEEEVHNVKARGKRLKRRAQENKNEVNKIVTPPKLKRESVANAVTVETFPIDVKPSTSKAAQKWLKEKRKALKEIEANQRIENCIYAGKEAANNCVTEKNTKIINSNLKESVSEKDNEQKQNVQESCNTTNTASNTEEETARDFVEKGKTNTIKIDEKWSAQKKNAMRKRTEAIIRKENKTNFISNKSNEEIVKAEDTETNINIKNVDRNYIRKDLTNENCTNVNKIENGRVVTKEAKLFGNHSKMYSHAIEQFTKPLANSTKYVLSNSEQIEQTKTTKITTPMNKKKNPPKSSLTPIASLEERPPPRRSPRNHLASYKSTETNPKTLTELQKSEMFSKDKNKTNKVLVANDTFELISELGEALLAAEAVQKAASTPCTFKIPNSPALNRSGDEIPSSQQIQTADSSPFRSRRTPQASRFYRSKRIATTQRSDENISPTTPANVQNVANSASIELCDLSLGNSLLKQPIQLNASHILSCSNVDTNGSSFKCIEVIDICGNRQLFEAAFEELKRAKRFGFSVGLQQQVGKRKPLIGANLLINQVGTSEQVANAHTQQLLFQLNDATYLAGVAFSISENVVLYMNMQDQDTRENLSSKLKCQYLYELLSSKAPFTLLSVDAKEQLKALRKAMPQLGEFCVNLEDPKVANWLLQPDKALTLEQMAHQFAPECTGLIKLCGSGRGYSSFGLDARNAILGKVRCSIEACVVGHILKGQMENLERIGTGQLCKFFQDLEMPLQLALCNMEHVGFPVHQVALQKLSQQILEAMKKLEKRIYELHGSRFNLGSSTAVARVLGLHRKPNGRVCTSKQILEKIDTPISQLIVAYRKLNVTLSKSIQPLIKCVENDRLHGQSITFTATGRISMAEPNLQNVAKDFDIDLGTDKLTISCRSAFYPTNAKRCLISSDFCQLEMRILAHLSQDLGLLQVMRTEKDVFTAIAARWNKIPESSVSEQLRNGTKQICYAIVYGMGVRSLAEALKCTEQEANLVSEQFHAAYPGIRSYADKIVKFARTNGYIETITGRRRYLEHIGSGEPQIKNQAERQAVNSTIQGSAADIAKTAILRVEKNVLKYCQKLGINKNAVQLVLHLHDELIFEVPEDKARKMAKVLSLTMENCVKLNVPLKVKLKIGRSWGELKEIKL